MYSSPFFCIKLLTMFTASRTAAYTAVHMVKLHVNSAASRESTTATEAQMNAATSGAKEPSLKYSAKCEPIATVNKITPTAARKMTTIRFIVEIFCPFVEGERRERL